MDQADEGKGVNRGKGHRQWAGEMPRARETPVARRLVLGSAARVPLCWEIAPSSVACVGAMDGRGGDNPGIRTPRALGLQRSSRWEGFYKTGNNP